MAHSVLHISETDAGGGSAASAYRIHSTLRSRGHRSRMLVGRKQTADADVRPLKRGLAWRAADRVTGAVADSLDLQYAFYASSFGVATDPWFRSADVVQLYNLHGSYFSHTALPFLGRRRPLVWRLSDMWAMTGHAAYAYDCERWRLGCGSCPYVSEYPALRHDRTALLWQLKRLVYARVELTLVAPSRWLASLAGASPLLSRFPIHWIPNGVDVSGFKPLDRREARAVLGLDPDRAVVLYSAVRLDDRRKGAHVLADALAALGDLDFQLVCAGSASVELPRQAHLLGLLDAPTMAIAYAAADAYVVPVLADNLPNVVLESMACGTPCVAFDVGGVGEAVRPDETGWLAPAGDALALAEGIRALLADEGLRRRLGARAREVAEREYADSVEAGRLESLYDELVAA
jgi:glycosyltransferase involved in cell wall biosynthesis